MHADQCDVVPDLALLAGEYWTTTTPELKPLSYADSTHEIESLKLYAQMIWPMRDMYEQRRTFLAHCALRLRDRYRDVAAVVRDGRDGIRRHPSFVTGTVQIYNYVADLGVKHLFDPSGGLTSALQKGRTKIAKDIDHQLEKMQTAVCLADFILRYLVHIKEKQRTASVNKAAFFIESGGYEKLGFKFPRHRSEIIQAWSEAKPTIIFGLAAFYSEPKPVFLSNILTNSDDPAEILDWFWRDDLRRQQLFGIARYCERVFTTFTPSRSKAPLLAIAPTMSTDNVEGLLECFPILQGFSDQDRLMLSKYNAKDHT